MYVTRETRKKEDEEQTDGVLQMNATQIGIMQNSRHVVFLLSDSVVKR